MLSPTLNFIDIHQLRRDEYVTAKVTTLILSLSWIGWPLVPGLRRRSFLSLHTKAAGQSRIARFARGTFPAMCDEDGGKVVASQKSTSMVFPSHSIVLNQSDVDGVVSEEVLVF